MAASTKAGLKPFTMVRRSVWHSARFAALPNDSVRYLYLYVLTCPQMTSSGCFVLKEGYALADLGKKGSDWSPAKYQAAKGELVKAGMILADEKTEEILILRWWKDNGPRNESHFTGAQKQCAAIKSAELRKAAQDDLEACWDAYLASKVPITPRVASGAAPLLTGPERLMMIANKLP